MRSEELSMVYPGDKRLRQQIMLRVFKEQFLNFLRRLVGKTPKEYSWESKGDLD
jgi:hypothetical protein